MNPTSLVTGGAGFIGSHLVDSLLERGHHVVALDDLSGGFKDNVNCRAEFVQGSITNLGLIQSVFANRQFDYVFHLAAYAAEGLSHFIRRFNYDVNLMGSINLINESVKREVKCFVFMSSIAVYGASQIPMSEYTIPNPEDPYGISKRAVELDLQAAQHMFGMRFIVFRSHNVYGTRQNIGDPYRNVIGIFMNEILQKQPLTIFGDGTQTRAFTHVSDVAPVVAKSVSQPLAFNEIFNIGSDAPFTLNQLAHYVSKAMGVEPEIKYLAPREEVKHAVSNHEKIQRVLVAKAKTPLPEGLAGMADWVKKIGARRGKPFRGIEIERNLPPSWRSLC